MFEFEWTGIGELSANQFECRAHSTVSLRPEQQVQTLKTEGPRQ